jgi:hypothetical protein
MTRLVALWLLLLVPLSAAGADIELWPHPDGLYGVTLPGTGTPIGDAELRLKATDFAGNDSVYSNAAYLHFGAQPPDTTPPSAPLIVAVPTAVRINVNGPEHEGIDHLGTWAADPGAGGVCGPSVYENPNLDILDTEDDVLFYGEVYGNPVVCQLELAPGDYEVTLLFAEIYLGVTCPSSTDGTGLRVFDIGIEGNVIVVDMDLYSRAGCGVPVEVSLPVTVVDGRLDIELINSTGTQYSPKISAIEVIRQ